MEKAINIIYTVFMFIIVYIGYQLLDIETAIIMMFAFIISELNDININLKNK
jgi:hypothetical protein